MNPTKLLHKKYAAYLCLIMCNLLNSGCGPVIALHAYYAELTPENPVDEELNVRLISIDSDETATLEVDGQPIAVKVDDFLTDTRKPCTVRTISNGNDPKVILGARWCERHW